jgi:hypothetical protein
VSILLCFRGKRQEKAMETLLALFAQTPRAAYLKLPSKRKNLDREKRMASDSIFATLKV